ncbi:MAG: PEP/pyruvate-binding domain-containing protein [Deltaproteobacteria bacterium]|nr:PEP/pyruvate-binding domain-containing protein [Deltaproteobacteria bacterium]
MPLRDRTLEAIVGRRDLRRVPLDLLMPNRVRNILLVSSLYDSFIFEEDGQLAEVLSTEYQDLNLRFAPRVERVSTGAEALDRLRTFRYDLVISMLRVGDMGIRDFGRAVKDILPSIPVVLLAYNTRELTMLETGPALEGIDRVFVWLGDHTLFLAIIKSIEDRLNVAHDAAAAGVQSLIVVEDSVRFYSAYLPMLYTEVVKQTQTLMTEGVNRMQRLIRMRARPKILLATSYEEAEELYASHRDHLLGAIVDAAFPRNGAVDPGAGLAFARMIKADAPDRPMLMQSSDRANEEPAGDLGASFVDKRSPGVLDELRGFMRDYLGFGPFTFRLPDGTAAAAATDLQTLIEGIRTVPDESLLYHAQRNDFSTWLKARTEFDLARALRPHRVQDFAGATEVREHILGELKGQRWRLREGLVAEFSAETFEAGDRFSRIGRGSLGGKGRGLAFVNALLASYDIEKRFPGVRIFVPPSVVLATDVFDEFMSSLGVRLRAFARMTDEEITCAFLAVDLPAFAMDALRAYLVQVRSPLAVRSSSILEDASHQPFAGVYKTCMLPNVGDDLEARVLELAAAVRVVYASTYFADARAYVEATPNRLEEEKMAVVLQQVVGRTHGRYVYPDAAGVARSYDFYPMEDAKPDDGVASVALGLGRIVVDGGRCLRFSPPHPGRLYQFSSPKDALASAQRDFLALDLEAPGPDGSCSGWNDPNVATLDLEEAERHGTLAAVGSIYSPADEAVYDGTSRAGVRLVTMAGILKGGLVPLPEILSFLLKVGAAGFSCPVELEFALNLEQDRPHEFGFLQIRPLVVGAATDDVDFAGVGPASAVCISEKALGHGVTGDVRDLVYVPEAGFDRARTMEIAREVGQLTAALQRERSPFVLLGPGRWGSADRWLGIPVTWAQIAGVECIVETDMKDIRVAPSQGTHFFQNITSFGIGYFTVGPGGFLDMAWLDAQEALFATTFVRHVRFAAPLEIAVDSRSGRGVIMKPGFSAIRVLC